jgi:transcriptional regulator
MPEGAFIPKLASAVVAFELPIARLEGEYKLSQNRSAADRGGVAAALAGGGPGEVAVAELMVARDRPQG